MEVRFRTRQLERRYADVAEAIRAWGPQVGRRYVDRITDIRSVTAIEDLYALRHLDFHRLTGDRRGQFGIRLTGQMRLICSSEGGEITIEEVVDYHG